MIHFLLSMISKIFFLFIIFFASIFSPATQTHSMKTFRMLNLGDSYTIGEAVPSEENFPHQLATQLNKSGIEISSPEIIAITGWTTDELKSGIKENPPIPPYDLVTLLIGVNNQYRGRSIDEYRIQFRELLNDAIKYANNNSSHVIVVSIPDWGVMPFAEGRDRKKIAEEIDAFNKVNEEEAAHSGTHYINITNISRDATTNTELIASDGLHPSGKQYSLWTEKIFPVAKNILSN